MIGYGTATSDRHRRAALELADELPDAELVTIDGASHNAHAVASRRVRRLRTRRSSPVSLDRWSTDIARPGLGSPHGRCEPLAVRTPGDRAASTTGRSGGRARSGARARQPDERRTALDAIVAKFPRYIDAWAQLGRGRSRRHRGLRLLPRGIPPRSRHPARQRMEGVGLRAVAAPDEPRLSPRASKGSNRPPAGSVRSTNRSGARSSSASSTRRGPQPTSTDHDRRGRCPRRRGRRAGVLALSLSIPDRADGRPPGVRTRRRCGAPRTPRLRERDTQLAVHLSALRGRSSRLYSRPSPDGGDSSSGQWRRSRPLPVRCSCRSARCCGGYPRHGSRWRSEASSPSPCSPIR